MTDIVANLKYVRQKIETAAATASRHGAGIQLVAVSKGKPQSDVRSALVAGQMIFGENRVQEAKAKFAPLRDEFPDLELHMIGPLQTNKAEEAVRLFDVIETLDRPNLAKALAKAIEKTRRMIKFYIEINSGQENQKAGIAPADAGAFLNYCRKTCGLMVEGLMCIPPQNDDPEIHFMRLKELAATLSLPVLSMGMSGDFETAIACGSTEVRIGTAIFGART